MAGFSVIRVPEQSYRQISQIIVVAMLGTEGTVALAAANAIQTRCLCGCVVVGYGGRIAASARASRRLKKRVPIVLAAIQSYGPL